MQLRQIPRMEETYRLKVEHALPVCYLLLVLLLDAEKKNAIVSFCGHLTKRLATQKRNPEIYFVEGGHSSSTVIEKMHIFGVSVFGTTRNFDGPSNVYEPFELINENDVASMIFPILFIMSTDLSMHRPNSQLICIHERVSGRRLCS